jgi:hypothetical protein
MVDKITNIIICPQLGSTSFQWAKLQGRVILVFLEKGHGITSTYFEPSRAWKVKARLMT